MAEARVVPGFRTGTWPPGRRRCCSLWTCLDQLCAGQPKSGTWSRTNHMAWLSYGRGGTVPRCMPLHRARRMAQEVVDSCQVCPVNPAKARWKGRHGQSCSVCCVDWQQGEETVCALGVLWCVACWPGSTLSAQSANVRRRVRVIIPRTRPPTKQRCGNNKRRASGMDEWMGERGMDMLADAMGWDGGVEEKRRCSMQGDSEWWASLAAASFQVLAFAHHARQSIVV